MGFTAIAAVAAIAAAKYARHAAEAARESATADNAALTEARKSADAAMAGLRPHLYLSALESNLSSFLRNEYPQVKWKMRIINAGGGPGRLVSYHINLSTVEPSGESGGAHTPVTIVNSAFAAGQMEDFEIDLTDIADARKDDLLHYFRKNRPMVGIQSHVRYADPAGREHVSSENWRIFLTDDEFDKLVAGGLGDNFYS